MDAYPDLQLIGCTTDGEASSVIGFAEDSATLMLFYADDIDIVAGIGEGARSRPREAAREAIESAMSGTDKTPALCIANPEGLGVNTHEILAGIGEAVGTDVPVCGGMSGDQLRFKQTFQFFGDKVYTDAVPVMVFAGPMKVSYAVAHGWKPIGDRHVVTRAEGNVVVSIDEKPASDLYTRYLQEHSLHFPLAVYPDGSNEFYLATPAAFDQDTGSVICQNFVVTGSEVQLADATRDDIIGGAAAATKRAIAGFDGTPAAALLFSCAGRRANLGTRTREEIERLQAVTGDLPLCGFYTYGELCPLPDTTAGRSHNCTFVTVLIGSA
jgi:hypothetical protein